MTTKIDDTDDGAKYQYFDGISSEIYCYGRLLDKIQMSSIFKDSKTFVDMKIRTNPEDTLSNFDVMMTANSNNPTNDVLKKFVDDNFEDVGQEFEDWTPDDWKENPTFLTKIKDADFNAWANDLNRLWLVLGRKMTNDVEVNPQQYSIIHVDNPVIVPGGRFREFYYWDSYWIVRGLLLSEMYHTTKGMLSNFLSIIERFGFIPNGGRVYYSKRSQPPLLAAMIKSYVDKTGDTDFAIQSVGTLEKEFDFWMKNHTQTIKGHNLALYGDKSSGPRPESYREDVETSNGFETAADKDEHYSELKAAAESGMDFSSRWFINSEGTNHGDLTHLKTRYIVPVELNAILYWNAKIIAEFYKDADNTLKSAEFELKAQEILEAINAVLWHEDIGAWLDYDTINSKRRDYFTPTNLSPLWMKCYNEATTLNLTDKVLSYIEKVNIDKYPGGVPNTLEATGEQWDFPNVWPPMQYMLIMGLDNLMDPRTEKMAYSWAERWVRSNFIAYSETQAMYEKYSAEEPGGHGGGGEYEVQLGFGWTNGVIMDLLDKYGDTLTVSDNSTTTTTTPEPDPGKAVGRPALFGLLVTSIFALLSASATKFFG